jgi:hypothetical protein
MSEETPDSIFFSEVNYGIRRYVNIFDDRFGDLHVKVGDDVNGCHSMQVNIPAERVKELYHSLGKWLLEQA